MDELNFRGALNLSTVLIETLPHQTVEWATQTSIHAGVFAACFLIVSLVMPRAHLNRIRNYYTVGGLNSSWAGHSRMSDTRGSKFELF